MNTESLKAIKIALNVIPESQRATTQLGNAEQVAWLIAELDRKDAVIARHAGEIAKLMGDAERVRLAGATDRNAALKEAANLCETKELLWSVDYWLSATKQEVSANTARCLAKELRALKSAASAQPIEQADKGLSDERIDQTWVAVNGGWGIVPRALIRKFVRALAATDAAPGAAQERPDLAAFALYQAINNLMFHIGMHGEIDSRHELVDSVMNELHNLDGGTVAQRVEDLIEKAHMPADQATRLAVNEFCAKGDSAAPVGALPGGQDDTQRLDLLFSRLPLSAFCGAIGVEQPPDTSPRPLGDWARIQLDAAIASSQGTATDLDQGDGNA